MFTDDGTRKRLGAFLTQAQFQSSVHSSNLVVTAGAQNLLCLQLAASVGVRLNDPFVVWLSGAWLPALLGRLLGVLLLHGQNGVLAILMACT